MKTSTTIYGKGEYNGVIYEIVDLKDAMMKKYFNRMIRRDDFYFTDTYRVAIPGEETHLQFDINKGIDLFTTNIAGGYFVELRPILILKQGLKVFSIIIDEFMTESVMDTPLNEFRPEIQKIVLDEIEKLRQQYKEERRN